MKLNSKRVAAATALVLLSTATPVLGQNTAAGTTTDPYATQTQEDDEFPWGLLGLLGLGGLLGLKRRDRDDDVRRTSSSGTGTSNR
jgi:MYXO-CTERM domain-containing protein